MKEKFQFISKKPQQTKEIGKKLATWLSGGEVIGLIGDLGGGKTTFTKGLAEGLKIKEPITSPGFLFLKEYKIPNSQFPIPNSKLSHFDFYRAKNENNALGIGLEEYLGKKDKICLIEWADKVKRILPQEKLMVEFDFIDENSRQVIFKPEGKRYQEIINKLKIKN